VTPAAFTIFWVDGTADGLWLADKAGWVGVAVVCPRTAWTQHKHRAEFDGAGVYVLDSGSGDQEEIYIGEADVLRARLDNHYVNKEWIRVVALTARDGSLNKAHVKHLESRLLALAASAHRATVLMGIRRGPRSSARSSSSRRTTSSVRRFRSCGWSASTPSLRSRVPSHRQISNPR
jgi:hypothetical protein